MQDTLESRIVDYFNKLGRLDILVMIQQCRGSLYGGAIRDIISGDKVSDFDVVIPQIYIEKYLDLLVKSGYHCLSNGDPAYPIWKCTKNGELPIEVYAVEDHPDDTLIGPTSEPDFDVNTLSYVNGKVQSWVCFGEDIAPIVDAIRNKIATPMSKPRPERIIKLANKGYHFHTSLI